MAIWSSFGAVMGLSRTESGSSFKESIYWIKNAQLGKLVVFLPGSHFARTSFNNFILVERCPVFAFPPGIEIVAVDPIGQINGGIEVYNVWLLIRTHRKVRTLSRRCY